MQGSRPFFMFLFGINTSAVLSGVSVLYWIMIIPDTFLDAHDISVFIEFPWDHQSQQFWR